MDRKIIQQSATSLGISLPKKWTSNKNLRKGDTVTLTESQDTLVLSATTQKAPPKEISIVIPKTSETIVRVHIWNAYRAGFDKIHVTCEGEQALLQKIIQEQLIGFEVFKKPGGYTLESVSEPSYTQMHTFIERQFFILQELLQNCVTQNVENQAYQLQKYDNFLKRCMTKNMMSFEGMPFLWQFLSHIIQISRHLFYLSKEANKKLDSGSEKYLKTVQDAFEMLRKAYFARDISLIEKLHQQNQKAFYKDGIDLLNNCKNKIICHYLLSTYREIYFSSSALMGYLYSQPSNSLSKL